MYTPHEVAVCYVCFLYYAIALAQWFIDFLFIAYDSRKSNKLCGRKTTKHKNLAL